MEPYTLVAVDTTGIQSYIFGSNRLRENVGASHLVHQATRGWVLSEPDAFLPVPHNIHNSRIDLTRHIENGELAAEVLYAGGGNLVILFRQNPAAVAFAGKLSQRLMGAAPGLDAVAVQVPMNWDTALATVLDDALSTLACKKTEREHSQQLLGLGVTARCRSTGLVANYVESELGEVGAGFEISAETKAKWKQADAAKDRLRRKVSVLEGSELAIPDQFDSLGRSEGDFSYIAVVHADGNNTGKILLGITEHFKNKPGNEFNRTYIDRLREFSCAVDDAGESALNAVVAKTCEWNLGSYPKLRPYTAKGGQKYLSIRPIVFGGDDVTFVCDGRIGLRLAQLYLDTFGRHQVPNAEGESRPAVGAAGVAIVKVHYPFARAYQLSEMLCKNAKMVFDRKVSALDWHMAQGGVFGDLGEIREREYEYLKNVAGSQQKRSLLMRPVSIGPNQQADWRTWENFKNLLCTFQNTEKWPRSRLMELREVLRSPEMSISAFVKNFGDLPPMVSSTASEYMRTGWQGNNCVYFDAIDMIEQEVWS